MKKNTAAVFMTAGLLCVLLSAAGSQEANVLRTYVETLLDLPWKKMSKDNDDIKHAEKILNEDHYGLEQVKERILEYLAVRALTKKGTSPIICLVGPPRTSRRTGRGLCRTSGESLIPRPLYGRFMRRAMKVLSSWSPWPPPQNVMKP